jgi:hypothetical protein
MVIQVTYRTVTDAKDPHSKSARTKYFDAPGSELPQKALIIRKLRALEPRLDENTVSIETHPQTGDELRKAGFEVGELHYGNEAG